MQNTIILIIICIGIQSIGCNAMDGEVQKKPEAVSELQQVYNTLWAWKLDTMQQQQKNALAKIDQPYFDTESLTTGSVVLGLGTLSGLTSYNLLEKLKNEGGTPPPARLYALATAASFSGFALASGARILYNGIHHGKMLDGNKHAIEIQRSTINRMLDVFKRISPSLTEKPEAVPLVAEEQNNAPQTSCSPSQPTTHNPSLFSYVQKGWLSLWNNPCARIKKIIETDCAPTAAIKKEFSDVINTSLERITSKCASIEEAQNIYDTLYILKFKTFEKSRKHDLAHIKHPLFNQKHLKKGLLQVGEVAANISYQLAMSAYTNNLSFDDIFKALKVNPLTLSQKIDLKSLCTFDNLIHAYSVYQGSKNMYRGFVYGKSLESFLEKDMYCVTELDTALQQIADKYPSIIHEGKVTESPTSQPIQTMPQQTLQSQPVQSNSVDGCYV